MQRWTYHVEVETINWNEQEKASFDIDEGRLKQLGNEGWELVGVAPLIGTFQHGFTSTVEVQYLFKRLLPDAPITPAKQHSFVELPAEDTALLQGIADRNPGSELAKSGIVERAQRAVAKKPSSNGKRSL